jgi:methylthioribose-1-phosphate isomerase
VCEDYLAVAEAIKSMKVRGAPAIGVAAAYGLVLGALECSKDRENWLPKLEEIAKELKSTRPTAVNLYWAIDRMMSVIANSKGKDLDGIVKLLEEEAQKIAFEDVESNRAIGRFGNTLVPQKANILTHCNTGALATWDYGTALGVIREAYGSGKEIHVFADETRPFLQGSRLTVWELMEDNIPVTLITDSMAGFVMAQGKVDLVVVGADRITANGDVANKIGTYSVAVLAKEHGIPFYVAAPMTTFDLSLKAGKDIPIEERSRREITHIGEVQVAPEKVNVYNPAFDVTPSKYITALITDKGIIYPPYEKNIAKILNK